MQCLSGPLCIIKINLLVDCWKLNWKCQPISSVGLLDAVSNLKTEYLGHVIHPTWDAPFSLDITGVDPDIWYRVDITVDNDPFNNSSGIVPFNTYFVNAPEFNFASNYTNTSVIHQFQITPLNGAGNGSTSAPVTGYFFGRELLLLKGQALTLTDLDKTWLLHCVC